MSSTTHFNELGIAPGDLLIFHNNTMWFTLFANETAASFAVVHQNEFAGLIKETSFYSLFGMLRATPPFVIKKICNEDV